MIHWKTCTKEHCWNLHRWKLMERFRKKKSQICPAFRKSYLTIVRGDLFNLNLSLLGCSLNKWCPLSSLDYFSLTSVEAIVSPESVKENDWLPSEQERDWRPASQLRFNTLCNTITNALLISSNQIILTMTKWLFDHSPAIAELFQQLE